MDVCAAQKSRVRVLVAVEFERAVRFEPQRLNSTVETE